MYVLWNARKHVQGCKVLFFEINFWKLPDSVWLYYNALEYSVFVH